MNCSKKDILRAIDQTFATYQAHSNLPISEEDLYQLQATLKSKMTVELLQSIFCSINFEASILEEASHYHIECLGLSARSYNGLVKYPHHIQTVADLLTFPLADLRNVRNLGAKSIAEIEQAKIQFVEMLKQQRK